jgi:apolipoprotein N-acyltransferase
MKKYLKTKFARDFLALFAGATLPLGFAPFGWYLLAVLSPALLLLVWLHSSKRQAFWRGWLFGLGFFGAGVYWVYISLHLYGASSVFFASFATVLLIATFALYPAVQGYLFNRFFPNNNLTKCLLAFPAIWVLFEWIRSWLLFNGFPWLLLGDSQIDAPLRGFAPVFSVFGVSLATVFTSAVLVAIFYFHNKLRTKVALFIVVILIWCSGITLAHIHWTQPIGKPLKVSLVQGNIPQQEKWIANNISTILTTYKQLTQQHWDSDIIVWPECAIVINNLDAQGFLQGLNDEAKQHNAAIITGIPVYKDFHYYNSVIALGNGQGIYSKRHLLPFGDYIPFRWVFGIFGGFVQIPMSDFTPGAASQPNLIAHGVTIAPFICYEIVFPTEVAAALPKAQLLLLVTDDSWFGDSTALGQHLTTGRIRALETGRYLLFDSNSGPTAIINAQGIIQSSAPNFQRYVLTGTVQPMRGSTPFVIWGIYPILIICGGLLALAYIFRKNVTNRR